MDDPTPFTSSYTNPVFVMLCVAMVTGTGAAMAAVQTLVTSRYGDDGSSYQLVCTGSIGDI